MVRKSRGKAGKFLKSGSGALVRKDGSEGRAVDVGIADRIVRVAGPFIGEIGPCDDHDQVVRSILGFAVAAWNSVLMPENQGRDLLFTVTTVPGLTVAELEELRTKVDAMVARRRELYPDDRRYVDNYRFSGSGRELRFEARVLDQPS